MHIRRSRRVGVLAAAALFAIAVVAGPALAAEDNGNQYPPPPPPPPAAKAPKAQKSQKSQKKQKKQNQGQLQELREKYQHARALILDGEYESGIAAMHAIGDDANPEIANYIGYASRKLGRYDEAKLWYEKALAADPNHVRTWSYYGAWHAEQGNLLMAQDYLEKVRQLCGNTTCYEYVLLKGVIEGTAVY
jgi:tetratricopeptide (TPR) repeat protein